MRGTDFSRQGKDKGSIQMEKKKKQGTILRQIMQPFVVFVLILILANAIVLMLFSMKSYLDDQYKEASRLARFAGDEFEDYRCVDWLFNFWENHFQEMEFIYSNPERLNELEIEFRGLHPEVGEFTSVTDEAAESFDQKSAILFAEIVYGKISDQFDQLKRTHKPLYLYSFLIRNNNTEMFIFATGTLDDEKRISQGGDLFELGFTMPYVEGSYPVVDEILSTQKPVARMELSRSKGANHSVIHAFEPVYDNGELKALIGVSYQSREMIEYSLRMMRTMLAITALFFAVMFVIVIHHIRKIVVLPIGEEKRIIEAYEQDKDSLTASRALNNIKTKNEIERLAESFSSMVTELDRYMEEYRVVTAEKERIGAELNVATHIQADMLPRIFPAFPDHSEFDLYATMTPAKEVGGDFYDFFLVDDDHIALVMADVSGKGVPAALFMVIAKTLIKNRAMLGGGPAEILSSVNDQLCEGNESELFVTVWLAIIEISTGKGVAANAGHEHPAIKHKDGTWELVVYRHSPAVATMEGIPFREHEFEISAGDELFVYTDGVAEATDKNDELYGTDRMLEALNGCASDDPKEYLAAVKKGIDDFVGDAPQFDDITMLGFTYRGVQS